MALPPHKRAEYITSSHEKSSEYGVPYFICQGGFNGQTFPIYNSIHSHPSNTPIPSGMEDGATHGDIPFAKKVQSISTTKTKFNIYLPGPRIYAPYTPRSKYSDF